ncbi:MAG: enoyl-CoA hydratase [Gemmatimonadetes bacterium]|nr:enoyl-CoA hydratase [Gemmatimonadota bacterium]
MPDNLVLAERREKTAIITFNDPSRANAMSPAMAERFAEVVSEVADDRSLRAVVITGAGRHFSAGGDLEMLTALTEGVHDESRRIENVGRMRHYYGRFLCVRDIAVPVIAAINGSAVGAGLCLALACDMRLVAREARLGFTFTRLGLHPGLGATYYLPRLVGPEKAFMLFATGREIGGAEAVEYGLASSAHSSDELFEAALALADQISVACPMAVRQVKRSLATALEEPLHERLEAEAQAQSIDYAQGQVAEGIAAVREKRAPRFAD